MATVTELVTEFSYKGSTTPLNKYNAGLNQSIVLLASMTAAVAVAGVAVAKWASGVLEGERSLFNLSYTTGIAIERIQQMSFAAEMMGSSSQSMQSSLESLSATIGNAAQKGSEDFARLGISVRGVNGQVRSADAVLFDVGRRFKQLNLSMSEQMGFASALGIDTSLLRMLNQTDGQMASLMQRAGDLGILNEEQTKQAERYNQALIVQRTAMDGLRRLIAVGLAPDLEKLADAFSSLIKENREWIIDGVKETIEILKDFGGLLERTWPVLLGGGGAFVAVKIAALGFAGVMSVLLSPVVLITAGIVALLLIVDDLIVAFEGGESVIRDFFLSFFDYDIKDIFSDFQALWESIKESFVNIFGGMFDWAKDAIAGILPEWALKLLNLDSEGGQPAGDPSTRPGGTQVQNSRSSSVNQEVLINVRSNDPERAARLTADNLQRQMDDAQTQANRGGV